MVSISLVVDVPGLSRILKASLRVSMYLRRLGRTQEEVRGSK